MKTPSSPIHECASKLNRLARENPAATFLVAVGCGLAVGYLVRTLRPHPPESRTARVLTDIRDRLQGIAAPVQRQAEHLIESGSSAVNDGIAHLRDLHLERGIRRLGLRVRNLFR